MKGWLEEHTAKDKLHVGFCYPKYKTNVLKLQSNKQRRNKLKTEIDTSANKMFRL